MEIIESEEPLTEADLDKAEQRMGVVLPDDLREHYLRANGGIPIPDSYEHEGEYFTISCFLPVLGEGDGIVETLRLLRSDERSPAAAIPFADDPNGDLFVYSTGPTTFGEIHFIQSDYVDDPEQFVLRLAPSLKAFFRFACRLP